MKWKTENEKRKAVTRKTVRALLLCFLLSTFNFQFSTAQQRTVIAGLEGNAEYRELIASENGLVRRADSLSREIASLRRWLRADTLDRASISAAIVSLEEQGFEIRSGMARLASRINTIEQEWILANLASDKPGAREGSETPAGDEPSGEERPAVTYRSWFETGLTADQMAELQRAREAETAVPRLVERFRENHGRLTALARAYGAASSQGAADSIRVLFEAMDGECRALVDRIGTDWSAAFDSESYLYNLLADKHNRADLLARFEEGLEGVRRQRTASGEVAAPAGLVDWVLQHRMMADYEADLAAALGDASAADSLRALAAALPGPLSLAGLEPVTIRERLFLDYADIKIGGTPYNASNPIPEVKVWPRGLIWRVMVGNFAQRQQPSVFRGAHPLGFTRSDDGRFRYFAGGFQTDSLAVAAAERLRKAGFRAPVPVVWMDGEYIDPAAGEGAKIYRIEITGPEELPAPVREAIGAAAPTGGPDIVRSHDGFIITPLDAPTAVRLRLSLETLGARHPEMEVKLSKIPE